MKTSSIKNLFYFLDFIVIFMLFLGIFTLDDDINKNSINARIYKYVIVIP